MNKGIVVILVAGVMFLTGCSSKGAESSKDAIEIAKTIEDAQEKINYLVSQAQNFYNSQEFQQAVETAQYVLSYLDKNSQDAKSILNKAKTALKDAANQAVSGVQDKIANFGQ